MNGAIGGVQVGYNWQAGNYLAGIEADFQGSGQRGTTSFNIPFQVFGFVGAPADGFVTERMPWFGTVRGRVGYVADRLLLFATGGVAYGRVETNSLAQANGLPFLSCLSTLCPIWNISESTTKIGWTVGGGAEWALDGKWSAKIEYLFVDLGSFNAAFAGFPVCVGVAGGCFEEAAGRGSINSRITDNIVRVGLNYRFSPAPVVAKY
jgi:outer membrane immunogenic protein